jgi:hypothetical protein
VFCRSLCVLLSFFLWPLCCLFFFDLQILITSLWYLQTLLNLSLYLKDLSTLALQQLTTFVCKKNCHEYMSLLFDQFHVGSSFIAFDCFIFVLVRFLYFVVYLKSDFTYISFLTFCQISFQFIIKNKIKKPDSSVYLDDMYLG